MAKFVEEIRGWDQSDEEDFSSDEDNELDFFAKQEDYRYLKYHKIKKSKSMV